LLVLFEKVKSITELKENPAAAGFFIVDYFFVYFLIFSLGWNTSN